MINAIIKQVEITQVGLNLEFIASFIFLNSWWYQGNEGLVVSSVYEISRYI